MPAFAASYGGLQDALDTVFAERIRITPRGSAGTGHVWRGGTDADPTRPVKEILGRYNSRPLTAELEGNRARSQFSGVTQLAGRSQTLRISPVELAKLGYAVRQGDLVTLLDRPDVPTFSVAFAQPRDGGEVEIKLAGGTGAGPEGG